MLDWPDSARAIKVLTALKEWSATANEPRAALFSQLAQAEYAVRFGNADGWRGEFDAAHHGIDFYESLEGMRVHVNNAIASGPTNYFGELPVLVDNGVAAGLRTARGGIVIRPTDFNPERIFIDDTEIYDPGRDPAELFAEIEAKETRTTTVRSPQLKLNLAVLGPWLAVLALSVMGLAVGLVESFSAFWASAYKEIIVFTLIIPFLLWRSLRHGVIEEEE